eukprot:TRINITY_DN1456_c0_g2_i12.p1 TRINITY_DN1456_c0_g2~~TRINITY_DN1456_c0_g2_i12.p1  ORF type:complete len:194 (+),score=41.53 TRINITY_DN1456_c0_g2_i12:321-902(+)
MTKIYYRNAVGGVIVFDLSRPSTLNGVSKWKDDVRQKVFLGDDSPIPLILLANKCDLGEISSLDGMMLDEFIKSNDLITWFPTSARSNHNIGRSTLPFTSPSPLPSPPSPLSSIFFRLTFHVPLIDEAMEFLLDAILKRDDLIVANEHVTVTSYFGKLATDHEQNNNRAVGRELQIKNGVDWSDGSDSEDCCP